MPIVEDSVLGRPHSYGVTVFPPWSVNTERLGHETEMRAEAHEVASRGPSLPPPFSRAARRGPLCAPQFAERQWRRALIEAPRLEAARPPSASSFGVDAPGVVGVRDRRECVERGSATAEERPKRTFDFWSSTRSALDTTCKAAIWRLRRATTWGCQQPSGARCPPWVSGAVRCQSQISLTARPERAQGTGQMIETARGRRPGQGPRSGGPSPHE